MKQITYIKALDLLFNGAAAKDRATSMIPSSMAVALVSDASQGYAMIKFQDLVIAREDIRLSSIEDDRYYEGPSDSLFEEAQSVLTKEREKLMNMQDHYRILPDRFYYDRTEAVASGNLVELVEVGRNRRGEEQRIHKQFLSRDIAEHLAQTGYGIWPEIVCLFTSVQAQPA